MKQPLANDHALLDGQFGYALDFIRIDPKGAILVDDQLDRHVLSALQNYYQEFPGILAQLSCLIVIPTNPSKPCNLEKILLSLQKSCIRYDIEINTSIGIPRLEKLNRAIIKYEFFKREYDWLIIIDEDTEFDMDFLNKFIFLCEISGFCLSQPAHRLHSFSSYAVTQRQPHSLSRETRFVEIGPVTAFHRRILSNLFPFPKTRHGWGVDFLWADLAKKNGWKIGIIDGATIEHLRPVGGQMNDLSAIEEAKIFLGDYDLSINRFSTLSLGKIIIAA